MSRKVMNCQGLCKFFRSGFRHIFLFFYNYFSFLMYCDAQSFRLSVFSKNFYEDPSRCSGRQFHLFSLKYATC